MNDATTTVGRNRTLLAQHADSLHRLKSASVYPGAHLRSADRLVRYAVDGLLAAETLIARLHESFIPLAADAVRNGVPLHDVAFLLIWSDDRPIDALTGWACDHGDMALLNMLGAGAVAA